MSHAAPTIDAAFAQRVAQLGTETVFAVSAEAAALAAEGKTVYPFHLGDLNLATPENIVQASLAAIRAGKTTYCPNAGIPQLREALAADVGRARGLAYAAENVSVQPGGKPVIAKFLLTLMDPGDEVLYPNPGFPIYGSMIEFLGGVAVPYAYLEESDGFRLDLEGIARAITPRTRLLILNDLHNPTAAECSPGELERLAELVREHDLLVLADEAYFDVRFEGASRSLVSLPGMQERCVILYTFSKKYAMTGWRLGAAIGPKPIIDVITTLNVNIESCPNHFVQYGAVAALTDEQSGPARDDGDAQGAPRRGSRHPELDAGYPLPDARDHVLPVPQCHGCREAHGLRRPRELPPPGPRPHRRVVLHPASLRPRLRGRGPVLLAPRLLGRQHRADPGRPRQAQGVHRELQLISGGDNTMKDLPTSVLNSRLTLLSEEKCQAIYDAALTIIAEIGMTVPHAVARELLVGAGATVEGEDLVRIPRELVAKARETVPSMIPVHDRNGELAMQLGGYNSFFGTGSDLMSIYDFETRERRQSVLADIGRMAHLCDGLPNIDFIMSAAHPHDVDGLRLLPRVLPRHGEQHHQADGHDGRRRRRHRSHVEDRLRVPRRRRGAARQAVLHPVRRAGQPAAARPRGPRQAALLRRLGHPADLLAGADRRRHGADHPRRAHRPGGRRVALRRGHPPAPQARLAAASPAWARSSST